MATYFSDFKDTNEEFNKLFAKAAGEACIEYKKEYDEEPEEGFDPDYSETGFLIKETKCNYPNGLGASACGYEKLFYETGDLKTVIDYSQGSDKKTITTYPENDSTTN